MTNYELIANAMIDKSREFMSMAKGYREQNNHYFAEDFITRANVWEEAAKMVSINEIEGKNDMTNFLEIKTIHGNIVLINVGEIATIREGVDVDYNFIWLINGDCTHTYESIEEIKAKL